MTGPWDARAWIASVVGCSRDDLTILSEDLSHGRVINYGGADGQYVGRLVMGGPLKTLSTSMSAWEIVFELADGTFHKPPNPVAGSAVIHT